MVRSYVWSLGPPNYLFARYVDFFEEFITRYIDEAKRIYGYSTSTSFNREDLGKNVRQLYQDCLGKNKKFPIEYIYHDIGVELIIEKT